MYNCLVTFDKDLNIVPELAESWETPDPKTYIFKLRKGVKFHDGTDFDAEVVKFNLERVLDPKTKSRGRVEIIAVESIDVLDPYTVKLNLAFPFGPLLAGLTDRAGYMISPTALKKMGPDAFSQHGVGTGPFQFVEWVKGDHMTLKKFDGYWEKGLPYLDRVILKPIPDHNVKLVNLKSGTLHMIDDVLPKDIARIKADKSLVYQEVPSYGFVSLRFNCTRPPFNNMALRQAVVYGVDREAIWKHIYYGTGVMGHGPIAPVSWAYDPNNHKFPYDIEKAKEKLKEGGKPNGFKFSIHAKQEPIDVQVAQAMQAQLKLINVETEIIQLDGIRHFRVMLDKTYDAVYGFWSGYPEPNTQLHRQFHSQGASRWTGYTNYEVDKWLEKGMKATDQAERKTYYSKALDIIIREAPMNFTYYFSRRHVHSNNVHGYVISPDAKPRLTAVWLEK
jgi:peptide/nickel transport system substrate-binding protein